MSNQFEVESGEDHYYFVRGEQDGDPVEIRVLIDPEVVASMGLPSAPDEDLVRATVSFLLEHQRIDELPPQLSLADVAAAYEGFSEQLKTRLSA